MADDVTQQQRRTTIGGIAAATVVTAGIWYALWRFLPPPRDANSIATAFDCCAVAALLTLVAGVEAVAHERLVTPAIDPLSGYETRRMRVNLRYLQNTLEQFVVFAAGLIPLAAYASPRTLIIITLGILDWLSSWRAASRARRAGHGPKHDRDSLCRL